MANATSLKIHKYIYETFFLKKQNKKSLTFKAKMLLMFKTCSFGSAPFKNRKETLAVSCEHLKCFLEFYMLTPQMTKM